MSNRSDERPVDGPEAPDRPHETPESTYDAPLDGMFSRGPSPGNGAGEAALLQDLLDAHADSQPAAPAAQPAAAAGDADTLRQLLMYQSSSGDLGKPYLTGLPQTYAAELVVFDWLSYLLDAVGFRGAVETLRYYRSIEWVSDGVERELNEYLLGFAGDDDGDDDGPVDHRRSLVFLAQLVSLH